MNHLTSKRHLRFHISILVGCLVFLIIGTGVLILYLMHLDAGGIKLKDQMMLLFCLCAYFMAFYTVFRYYKNVPTVKIENDNIYFAKKSYPIESIKKLELTGKRDFPYIVNFPMEAATLTFNNGERKFIYNDMYDNIAQLKACLSKVVIEKTNFLPLERSSTTPFGYNIEKYDTFNGDQLTSIRGIALWGMIGMIVCQLSVSKAHVTFGMYLIVGSFSMFWFIMHSWTMHYFELSQHFLIIKNQNLFWRKKIYELSDIREVIFETSYRMPNYLRIITMDYNSKSYPAATLRDKTWLQFKKSLEHLGVPIRNECNFTLL